MMKRGLFITFEGLDKSGKSTQIAHLQRHFEERGLPSVVTREPGGTGLGEALRTLVMQYKKEQIADETELMLFAASRAQLVRNFILPNIEQGTTVLCDRFADSTVAYQGFARGMDPELISTLNHVAVGSHWPDMTILLDLTVEESFRRLGKVLSETHAANDRFEDESRAFHERVRAGFLAQAEAYPQRIVRLDATQGEGALAEVIWNKVKTLLE